MSGSLALAEEIGRSLLAAEQEAANRRGIDDREHIPRMKRIADTVAAAAAEEIDADDVEAELAADLLRCAKELYLATCMSNIAQGEDPEEWREESEAIFEEILAGRDPWRRSPPP